MHVYLQYPNTPFTVMTSTVIKVTIIVAVLVAKRVAKQPCLACKTFSALKLSSDIKIFYCLHFIYWILKLQYAKTTCLITVKLTAYNKNTLSLLHINFLIDQLWFKVTINFIILMSWCHSQVPWSCEYMVQLEFFKNVKYKWSNDWFIWSTHHSCAFVYITVSLFRLAPPLLSWPAYNVFYFGFYHF